MAISPLGYVEAVDKGIDYVEQADYFALAHDGDRLYLMEPATDQFR